MLIELDAVTHAKLNELIHKTYAAEIAQGACVHTLACQMARKLIRAAAESRATVGCSHWENLKAADKHGA